MASANTEGFRLVRCPKCFNVLPEPPNVTVYRCGGCSTTLRAKIRAGNGQQAATKQVRQDSDNYSVATSVSNGVPPQNKDQASSGAAMANSCIADAPSAEHDSNGIKSNENGDVLLAERNAVEVENTENKDSHNFDDQYTNSRMEGPAELTHPNPNGTCLDPGEAENHTVEQSADNSESCTAREDDDTECRLNASENNMLSPERSKVAAVSMQDSEQKGTGETEDAANTKNYLVRVQSRSCDLRASGNSLDFHSARTSLQSKSFRASEPLQSKIMNTVDELKGDLSELFSKPPDCKPRAYPPRHSKQDGYKSRATITSSAPLAAYHPAAKHSSHASRLSRSGQVAPRGLPSLRYRRHRAYSYHHSVQMEMRPCRHECCHSCRPPCYRSCKQEPEMHGPPVKEIKRRPPPRHHCRPVLRGAPFVICSNCLNLLQLPTDFAVPGKGARRVKCGSCSEVLSYSYRDPSRKKLQSPFGGDEYSTDGYEIHQAADGQHNTGFHQSEAKPVSYSEEYGLSFGVSYSTSTEDGQPLHVSRNSSFNTNDETRAKDGKLHRLMGYSSASELLRHSPDLYESFDRRTPDARTHVDRKGKGICMANDDSGEQDSAVKRSKARSVGLPLQGILKKGIHGLESLKLRS
ncbi:protein ENHANCED DISEASE RESISTANCE 4-like [Phragmites australis]|uniref:protein ENHANCED DISEASE RESISTANCE 4-like n=1 Tax=Phragmites australis TaxID=29695 RepID=UPI002D7708A8|nr:protein ENHANCED DISEASE RESISTANCE 4-like [Phragmites australis]XP_062211169.1 protein ENHANCED DISEASE RESISTANCE 4-like [Phragmites australis]XP_062211170.1 protein ENHANCED DISEASE RESISTANCE 4-like [Phragmites australis]